jgi:hypothetical protein
MRNLNDDRSAASLPRAVSIERCTTGRLAIVAKLLLSSAFIAFEERILLRTSSARPVWTDMIPHQRTARSSVVDRARLASGVTNSRLEYRTDSLVLAQKCVDFRFFVLPT